jgi:hypothetical protein
MARDLGVAADVERVVAMKYLTGTRCRLFSERASEESKLIVVKGERRQPYVGWLIDSAAFHSAAAANLKIYKLLLTFIRNRTKLNLTH